MSGITLSVHGEARMQQRGLREDDLVLILQCGSALGEDVFFLTRKDADREICRRKREIQALERLRDRKVVIADGIVVTCYRSRRSDQKRMLRKRRGRA